MVFQIHTRGSGVAPIVHLAAPVDAVDGISRSEEPAVAAVALEAQRVAARRAFDNLAQLQGSSLAPKT